MSPKKFGNVRCDDGQERAGTASRVEELDALRGLAAIAVVIFHANPRWLRWGWASVDLFFVLSGYLITTIILRYGNRRGFLVSFYARRALRIWPLYYLAIALVVAATPLLAHKPNWPEFPFLLTFTQGISDVWTGQSGSIFSVYLAHTWTLCIEEQFYLIWPALILLTRRAWIIPLAIGVIALSVTTRSMGWGYVLLPARADGLAMGALLAALAMGAEHDPRRRKSLAFASLAALVVGICAVEALHGFTFLMQVARPGPTMLAYNVMFCGAVGLAVAGAGRPALSWLRLSPLVWLGTVSYGLYLIHLIIFNILSDVAQTYGVTNRPAWLFVPAILVSLALAELSYRWIELPFLSLKSRFPYSPKSKPHRPSISAAVHQENR